MIAALFIYSSPRAKRGTSESLSRKERKEGEELSQQPPLIIIKIYI